MTFSRDRLIGAIGLLVILGLVIYASTLVNNLKSDQYSGLVTEINRGLDEATQTYFKSRLATTQASIIAAEDSGEEIDLNLYISAASDAYSLGDLVTAREMLEMQIDGNPLYPVAWNNYAFVLTDMMDLENAEHAFVEAINLDPGYPKYREDYARFLVDKYPERIDDLKQVYEDSIDVGGQAVWSLVGLAELYAAQGDCDRAESHYEVAIDLEPDDQALKDDFEALMDSCTETP